MLTPPVFLQGYDFIGELMKWSLAAGKENEKRHWDLRQWERSFIVCELTWRGTGGSFEGQMCGVRKVSSLAAEAAWLALDEAGKSTRD
jgi:hypothetical protein